MTLAERLADHGYNAEGKPKTIDLRDGAQMNHDGMVELGKTWIRASRVEIVAPWAELNFRVVTSSGEEVFSPSYSSVTERDRQRDDFLDRVRRASI